MEEDKAVGPDGFNLSFIKMGRSFFLKRHSMEMFLNYKEKTSNNGMNATTFIALTPKNENLMELKVS